MTKEILNILLKRKAITCEEIATKLNIRVNTAQAMMDELKKMNYVEQYAVRSSNETDTIADERNMSSWAITEKGLNAVGKRYADT